MLYLQRITRLTSGLKLTVAAYSRKLYSTLRKYPLELVINDVKYKTDEWTNIPPFLLDLTKRELHNNPNHPIGILRDLIERNFLEDGKYTFYSDFKPVVTKFQNFDVLGFPEDHPGRSKSDTYYVNKEHLLRTHTSAHELECFTTCKTPGYFICADVYRKDEIDRTHYPAFHQLEGARIWNQSADFEEQILKDIAAIPKTNVIVEDPLSGRTVHEGNPKQDYMTTREAELIAIHLKRSVESLVNIVFETARESARKSGSKEPYLNEPLKIRWVEEFFPWTSPSWEIEVWWKGEWLECCGSGIVKSEVLLNSGLPKTTIGWAFGIGLDRIAMLLFGIPDIRLFWSLDERFSQQFSKGNISTFVPYSKFPGITRDVSFWLGEKELHVNDVMEYVRTYAGDLAESVTSIDEFVHPKTGRRSQTYRVNYQSMDRNLTRDEVNVIHEKVEGDLVGSFGVEIR